MRTKWDWEQTKLDYLASNHQEVKSFFVHFYGTFNSTIKHKTVGWVKMKKLHVKRGQIKALEGIEEKHQLSAESSLEKILCLVCKLVQEEVLSPKLTVKELYTIWKILRTTAGLPISYNSKSQIRAYQVDWKKESEQFELLRAKVLEKFRN